MSTDRRPPNICFPSTPTHTYPVELHVLLEMKVFAPKPIKFNNLELVNRISLTGHDKYLFKYGTQPLVKLAEKPPYFPKTFH